MININPFPSGVELIYPKKFTYPFCYVPHPLCLLAAEEIKREIARHPDWACEVQEGKMLGVLVVEGGFLAAFSGTLCGRGTLPYFVPPVFDLHGTYFEEEETRISQMPMGEERKRRSQDLQQWLFSQFRFLNARGEERGLLEIFGDHVPPSGAGECCAPKLLQYAYQHGLRPLCMGEFWMGRSPRGEVREEGHFYPSCQHKCKPILSWMLQGLDVEENPMAKDYERLTGELRTIYSDDDIVVIDKPSGLLSVQGKDDLPSVETLMKDCLMVHRLDMDTSGLMVLARNREMHKRLQEQFIRHEVRKRYTAWLEREMVVGTCGTIDLKICPNPYDRPRQIVNEEYGRRSITHYEVVGNQNGHAIVHLRPDTGRTHQLRLHMAAQEGLGNPIVGDRLYGHYSPDERLMLFADELEFCHPRTGNQMQFRA